MIGGPAARQPDWLQPPLQQRCATVSLTLLAGALGIECRTRPIHTLARQLRNRPETLLRRLSGRYFADGQTPWRHLKPFHGTHQTMPISRSPAALEVRSCVIWQKPLCFTAAGPQAAGAEQKQEQKVIGSNRMAAPAPDDCYSRRGRLIAGGYAREIRDYQ